MPSLAQRAAGSKYKTPLYSGNTPVRTWYVPDANASRGNCYFNVSQPTSDAVQMGGSCTIEPLKLGVFLRPFL